MEVKAIHRYARISPLKAREVAREIQGLAVSAALDTLRYTPKKAAALYEKVLKSAIANAEHNFDLDVNSLYLKTAVANTGPVYKRIKPRARGSAATIRKPLSHLLIVLSDEAREDRRSRREAARTTGRQKSRRSAGGSTGAPQGESGNE